MNTPTTFATKPASTWPAEQHVSPKGNGRALPGRSDSETAEKIEQTISYMMDHLNRSLQVAQLASMANVSPSHYFALFKRRTGSAPMDYFTRLRMKYACQLLDTTSDSVKTIAARLGYEDQFYFSRVFKGVNRVSPSLYRQQQLALSPTTAAPMENPPCESLFRPFRPTAAAV